MTLSPYIEQVQQRQATQAQIVCVVVFVIALLLASMWEGRDRW